MKSILFDIFLDNVQGAVGEMEATRQWAK